MQLRLTDPATLPKHKVIIDRRCKELQKLHGREWAAADIQLTASATSDPKRYLPDVLLDQVPFENGFSVLLRTSDRTLEALRNAAHQMQNRRYRGSKKILLPEAAIKAFYSLCVCLDHPLEPETSTPGFDCSITPQEIKQLAKLGLDPKQRSIRYGDNTHIYAPLAVVARMCASHRIEAMRTLLELGADPRDPMYIMELNPVDARLIRGTPLLQGNPMDLRGNARLDAMSRYGPCLSLQDHIRLYYYRDSEDHSLTRQQNRRLEEETAFIGAAIQEYNRKLHSQAYTQNR